MTSSEALLDRCHYPPPGAPLTCAVSGGADSLALLVLAVRAGCAVTVLHVDHGLRPGSAQEGELVHAVARRMGAEFRSRRVVIEPGPNLEARARAARRQVFPPGTATGHTMDDQAETILLNLLRGAGLDGLAGMRPGPMHPILELRRAETRAVCAAEGLQSVEDPTNLDRRFLRNRVRHELLPMCSALAARDVVPVLARQAHVLADEAELLDDMAADLDAADASALAGAPAALARRAVRQWVRGTGPYPPDLAAVERILAVARGEMRGTDVAPGCHVARSRGRLSLAPVTAAGEVGPQAVR